MRLYSPLFWLNMKFVDKNETNDEKEMGLTDIQRCYLRIFVIPK